MWVHACSVTSDCLQPHGLQHTRIPCPSLSSRVCSDSCLLNQWCSLTKPSHPLLPPSSFAFNLSQHQGLFQWVSSCHQVAKVLELQPQHQSLQWIFRIDFIEDWLVWSPICPRNSQECCPAPQLESNNSLVLSLLYGPCLSSVSFPGSSADKESTLIYKTPVPSLGQEDLLEKANHSSILTWRIPWAEESGRLQSMESPKSQKWLSDFHILSHICT